MKKTILIIVLCLVLSTFASPGCRAEYRAEEAYLLARAAESMAGGEGYVLLLAVSSVFVNRVKSEFYPDSLSAVIADAGIVPRPDEPSAEALRAAADALKGADPTSGALQYSHNGNSGKRAYHVIKLDVGEWIFY